MNRILLPLGAASLLVLVGVASAGEQQLTTAQMDGITAGGNAAANAFATAFGYNTQSLTSTTADQFVTQVAAGQLGDISHIQSTAQAQSASGADAISLANANGYGQTYGNGLSDSASWSSTVADSVYPMSSAYANNTSMASSLIYGLYASATSVSSTAAQLANPAIP